MATKKKTTSKGKTIRNGKAVVDHDQDLDADDVIDSLTPRPMPWFGWLGLAIMIVGEITMLLAPIPKDLKTPATIFIVTAFTPFMWTGYIMLIDGWIWARGGRSFFRDGPLHWPMLALFSILIWVMFEGFNFAVQAWHYGYIPANPLVRNILYAWAFATIIPAMLRTRSLFATFKMFDKSHQWDIHWTPFKLSFSFVAGIAFTFLPVMLDWKWANICVGSVWIGFIFLIEPIIYYVRPTHSIFRDLESPKYGGNGKISFFWQAFWAGLLCGFIWESWNWQTYQHHGLYWIYNINEIYWKAGFGLHWGKMPILGFLGYPPFIWECYALFELVEWTMHGDVLWKLPAKVIRSVTSRANA
jgi:hypothetical protein